MIKLNNFQFLLLIIFIASSCQKGKNGFVNNTLSSIGFNNSDTKGALTVSEIQDYVIEPSNGLVKTKQINEFKYQIKYKPVDYVIASEVSEKDAITKKEYLEKLNELDGLQYFDIRVEVDGFNGELIKYNLSSEIEYERRVEYLAFKMQNDIKLIDGLDTSDCVLYHMERAYDVVPYTTILLGFKKSKINNGLTDKTIVFRDHLFKNGIIKFTFIPADIQRVPNLQII